MSFQEVKDMLRMINIDMNDIYAYTLFKVTKCPPLIVMLYTCDITTL